MQCTYHKVCLHHFTRKPYHEDCTDPQLLLNRHTYQLVVCLLPTVKGSHQDKGERGRKERREKRQDRIRVQRTKKNMKERLVAAVPAILLSFFPQSLNVSMAYKGLKMKDRM